MIKHLRVKNFRSLVDVSVALEPLTVLIGRSGSGKTNFVQAIRWLRDFLTQRNLDLAMSPYEHDWNSVLCATAAAPDDGLSFHVLFSAPGFREDFTYTLRFVRSQHRPVEFSEEELILGERVLYHLKGSRWVQPPPLVSPPPPGGTVMLGALTGLHEATIAHLVLTNGIGCYSFPDQVPGNAQAHSEQHRRTGLHDDGSNILSTFIGIADNLQTWQNLKEIVAALRLLKPNLKLIELEMPGKQQIVITLEFEGKRQSFRLMQESEGFRRLLACLLALYQTPPKVTLVFDEPEKGIYPAGLAILAEEFHSYATRTSGQVILTTHSPEFLDHFASEQIRVVEMRGYATQIGPVASEQVEAIRAQFLRPGELLTVDQARLAEPSPVE